MNKILKWAGAIMALLLVAALASSCSSSRHLGCPMKITSTGNMIQTPAA